MSFPVKSASACQFKWNWSVIYLQERTTNIFCRCQRVPLTLENFKDFHNLPEKLDDRKLMLDGQWPTNKGCQYCQSVEKAGGKSERNAYVDDIDIIPKEMLSNPTEINVTPRILEVYFNNTCNLTCLYCSPANSSLIEKEYYKFGQVPGNSYSVLPVKENNEAYVEKFWEWMKNNSNNLKVFNILGGEPLHQTEFKDCIDFFNKYPNPEITFGIFSNLQQKYNKFKEKIETIEQLVKNKKIQKFNVVCSIDCWGPESEFVRKGLDLVTWEKNFALLCKSKYVTPSVHMTATPMSLKTSPDLIRKIHEYRKYKPIAISLNTVTNPKCLNPYAFGKNIAHLLEPILDEIHLNDSVFFELTDGIYNKMKNSEPDIPMIKQFVSFMDVLDFRRKTEWRNVFPELNSIIQNLLKNTG
jgi:hypothetical protein